MDCSKHLEKRQLGNGLVLSGSAVGVVAFQPFVEWLLKEFGLKRVFLILGGVSLNTVIIGALIPPLDTSENKTLVDEAPQSDKELKDEEKQKGCGILEDLVHKVGSFIVINMFKNWKYATFVAASCFVDPIMLTASTHMFLTLSFIQGIQETNPGNQSQCLELLIPWQDSAWESPLNLEE